MNIALKESSLYTRYSNYWNIALVILISLAFVLSDWSILYSSFGDFIFALALILMLGLKLVRVESKQLLLLIFPFIVVIISSTYSYFFYNHWFQINRILLSSAKIGLYLMTLVLFYNFIVNRQLEWLFLKVSNQMALLMVFVSVFIMLLIYFNFSSVYNFIWTFTRTDELSYTYGADIIRARGLFSEPAHLGYYLNTIFFANIFSKFKKNYFVLIVLTFGIILTFSYSMIAIYVSTGSMFLLKEAGRGRLKWSSLYIVFAAMAIGWIYLTRDLIYVAIIQRTANILSGTDGSAYNRIFDTWMWVDRDRIMFGNLIGHTPPLTNIYAYMLSDFGLLGFVPYILFTLYIALNNFSAFILFVGMNTAKGGYLNPAFWLFLFYVIVFYLKSGPDFAKGKGLKQTQ